MTVTHIGKTKLTTPIVIDCACRQGWLCDKCYIDILKLCYGRHFSIEEAKAIRQDPKRCVY